MKAPVRTAALSGLRVSALPGGHRVGADVQHSFPDSYPCDALEAALW